MFWIFSLKPNVNDSLCLCAIRFYSILNFVHSLLSCGELVVFPVVLAHEFGMGVETSPLSPILEQDLFNVAVMNPSALLKLLESRSRFFLVLDERRSRTDCGVWSSVEAVVHGNVALSTH